MSVSQQRIEELARKWMSGTITPGEITEFMEWYNNADDGHPLTMPSDFAADEVSHGMRMFRNIYEANKRNEQRPSVHRVHFLKTAWFRYAAAIIIALAVGIYFFASSVQKQSHEVAQLTPANDVKPPTSANAVITLSDGTNIVIDSASNGAITKQGDVTVTKLADGRIVYQGTGTEATYNTLTNPRGSNVVELTLADGTKVWLNAASSITYPTAFNGNERAVEVNGEIYFEVKKEEKKAFIVKKNGMQVRVLGTHFNINAYDEEDEMEVTLLEGAVQVTAGDSQVVQLRPGEQSQLTRSGNLSKTADVDVEAVMAWKNGKFDFGIKSDMHSIMRQLSRWYNVEPEYRGNFAMHFGGSISRQVNLSQVLKVLEATGNVHFEVQGRKVIVLP